MICFKIEYILIVALLLYIFLNSKKCNKLKEHFQYSKCSDDFMKMNNSLKQVQYTRLNLPIKIKIFLDHIIRKLVLLKLPGAIEILDYFDVSMKVDKMDNVIWLVHMLIYDKCSASTHKIFIEFWMFKDHYVLKSLRFYDLKDNHPFQFNDKLVSLHNNKYHSNKVIGVTNSVLEYNDIEGLNIDKDGKQAMSKIYNKWIIPKHINSKNSYITFTPDFYQRNYNDSHQMFKLTLGMPGYPNAIGNVN